MPTSSTAKTAAFPRSSEHAPDEVFVLDGWFRTSRIAKRRAQLAIGSFAAGVLMLWSALQISSALVIFLVFGGIAGLIASLILPINRCLYLDFAARQVVHIEHFFGYTMWRHTQAFSEFTGLVIGRLRHSTEYGGDFFTAGVGMAVAKKPSILWVKTWPAEAVGVPESVYDYAAELSNLTGLPFAREKILEAGETEYSYRLGPGRSGAFS